MTFRERLEWIFRMALLAFILMSVAFLSALTAMRFAIQGREVAMPDVVGKKAVEAQQILQGRGVEFKVEDRLFNPLPADTVVRQTPPPGMKVKIGQYAHVIISLGPKKARFRCLPTTAFARRASNCCAPECRSAKFPRHTFPEPKTTPFCSRIPCREIQTSPARTWIFSFRWARGPRRT